MRNYILAISSTILLLTSCGKQEVVCDGSTRTYDADIKVIIDDNCVSCHSSYDTYSGVMTDVDNGSFETEVISRQSMPREGDLTRDELTKIKCWLEQGAPEN
jgi:uncharacterized membrane protein